MSLYLELEKRGLLDHQEETAAAIMAYIPHTDIATADVRTLWRVQALWLVSGPTTMSGKIQTGLDNGSITGELALALEEMYSSLFGGSATVLQTYTNTDIASRIAQAAQGLLQLAIVSLDEINEFYALGGGLMFPGCTAADVQEAKDLEAERIALEKAEEERQQRSAELAAEYEQAKSDAGVEEALFEGDRPALIVALRDTADSLEQ